MHGEPAGRTDQQAPDMERRVIAQLQEQAAEILRSAPSLAGVQVGAIGNPSSLGRLLDFRKDLVLIFGGKAPFAEGGPSSQQLELSALCIEPGVPRGKSKAGAQSLAERVARVISGAAHACGGSGHFAPASPFVVPFRDTDADPGHAGPNPGDATSSEFMVVRFVARGMFPRPPRPIEVVTQDGLDHFTVPIKHGSVS